MHKYTAARIQTGVPAWFRHVSISVAYCFIVALFREALIPHWVPLCGIHLAVLLLVRYRYWPALIFGEMFFLIFQSIQCASIWGQTWALINIIPTLVFVAPVAYLAREKWCLISSKNSINIGVFLASAMLAACLVTINSTILLSILNLPVGYGSIDYQVVVSRWLLGNYLGVLTVVPFILFLHQLITEADGIEKLLKIISNNRLLVEAIFLILPGLAFLIWIGLIAKPETQLRQISQVAMFLPVVWFALRHGWEGAAVSGTASSFSIVELMPQNYDQSTLQAEVIISFVMSTMLLVGARIALLDRNVLQERTGMKSALALAQRNFYVGEMRLQVISAALERVRNNISLACAAITEKSGTLHPAVDGGTYDRYTSITQEQLYRLADTLFPLLWQEHGLLAALQGGPIPRMLDEVGINYWFNFRGSLVGLSPILKMTVYRLVSEVIIASYFERNATEIGIRLRLGERNGRTRVVLSISFRFLEKRARMVNWNQHSPLVEGATSGLNAQVIKDRVATFEGQARDKSFANERRISMILFEPMISKVNPGT